MSHYIELALEQLKKKGFRITKPRRLVLELLDKTDKALSPYQIKDTLTESGEAIDTVSVYRIIECLEENGLVHRVMSNGKIRRCQLGHEDHCELHQDDHCHHLLICQNCNAVEEVHCSGIGTVFKELEQKSQFKIKEHHLEFWGLCPQCA